VTLVWPSEQPASAHARRSWESRGVTTDGAAGPDTILLEA